MADGTKLAGTMINKKSWPWKTSKQRTPILVAITIRVGCAAAVSGVFAAQHIAGWSNQPVALFLIGVAAPSVVQQGARIGRVIIKAVMHDYFPGGGNDGA
ncbi:hypothetical protein [Micromonospora trifolii]|uniref:hypothetical protein n=1 Tax=Micromonospora trifolii TaxID=2911208 RepID=UPI003CF0D2A3